MTASFVYRRSYRGPVVACVFDWAGTMVDHGSLAPTSAFREAFAAFGVAISEAEARGPMGRAKLDHVRDIGALPAVAERWQAARGRPFDENEVQAVYADFIPRQVATAGAHADLIPGAADAAAALRARGVRIGATTGYTRAIMAAVAPRAEAQGYAPDVTVCADDIAGRGRPAPGLLFQAMTALDAWPPAAVVKVGDTVADVEEGLNAGVWSVAVTETGSEMGLSLAELEALTPEDRAARRLAAADRLTRAGAHFTIPGVADLPEVIDAVEAHLARGETP
ncbi:phosphonoacetaldehyde hydrolase [Roseospira goensis]|uniref:Phosphonoacetaldehyde hydrolase n=1 Tax=Roseospira goensis TaxID=391922 RepID=A0A7W6RY78_9PROT|nr:phosphonoacetaldehyde hydrolase [Roseospira goensis]MBB4284742.1 phosphonoacetaldehyde hydrolase [Roseospira goensis]